MPKNTIEEVQAYIQSHNVGTIVGVDEAGRGTWAGPIIAAAAAVPATWNPHPNVRDSKTLSRPQMEAVYSRYANDDHLIIGIGIVYPDIIDEIGIDKAQAKAQGDAIRSTFNRLAYRPFVIVDGINLPAIDAKDVESIMLLPKADALIPAVSLASIFAKVTQLRFMDEYEVKFPGYGFSKHAGYGTKEHQSSLTKLGPCAIHRRSFSPVRKATRSTLLVDILGGLDDND